MSHFDARAAKLLQPGEHLAIEDHPGLRLEASVRGKSWIYRYRNFEDGRVRQFKIGAWSEVSVSAAIVAWEGLRERRASGIDPALEKKKARAAVRAENVLKASVATVRVVCSQYLEEHVMAKRKPKGAEEAFAGGGDSANGYALHVGGAVVVSDRSVTRCGINT